MFSRFPSVPAPTTRTFVEAWLYPKRREGLPCPPAAGASAEARHSSHHHPSRGVSYHSIRSSACRPPTPQNTSVNQPNSFRMRTYAKRSNNPFRIALTKIPRGRGNHLTTIPNRYRRTLARPNPPCSSHLGPVSARGLRQICPPQPKPGAPSPAAAADFLTGIDTSPFLAIFLVLYIIFSTVPGTRVLPRSTCRSSVTPSVNRPLCGTIRCNSRSGAMVTCSSRQTISFPRLTWRLTSLPHVCSP
jgi:hypothetical protein